MSDPRFFQEGLEKQFDHLVEECGEFISAYGKMRRWGAFSVNPLLDKELQEDNIQWVLNEIGDIFEAIQRLRATLRNSTDKQVEEAFPTV